MVTASLFLTVLARVVSLMLSVLFEITMVFVPVSPDDSSSAMCTSQPDVPSALIIESTILSPKTALLF